MRNLNERGILTVVSGFSGSGKGTLMRELLKHYDCYVLSISATSRKPRPGEKEGESYFFKTREEFEEMIRKGELLEHAEYVGNYYGTPKKFVDEKLAEGKDVILEIEIDGAMQIRDKYPDALLVFVTPPDAKKLRRRIESRGTEDKENIEKRMRRAEMESYGMSGYDYIVVNDDLEECTRLLHEIIQASHYRPEHQREFLDQIRKELKQED